jgi:hypothetical protein
MYAISLPKHVVVVLSNVRAHRSACGTDVHRVARAIDACILEKDSHRQNKMIM